MKSAVLVDVGRIELEDRAIPVPGDSDVLIKVMACGVCGTDAHIFAGDKGAADNPLPIVLGHEIAGVVECTGEKANRFKQGDRVCIDPNVLCGGCEYCLSGIGHFCESMTGIGTTVDGGFSEYCVAPEKQCYPLGENVSFTEGAMAEPLACCLHGIDECAIKAGDSVVVIGGGLIGNMMLQLALISGAARVALIEPVASRREAALKLGATVCIDPSENIKDHLADAGIGRANAVIECVGNPNTIRLAIDIAGKRSTVMMFGLTKPKDTVSIYPYEFFKKEVTLKSSFINP